MIHRVSLASIALVSLALVCGACHHERPAEGPAERAGRSVDETSHDAKEDVKDAAHDTKEAVKDSAHDVKKDVKKDTQ